MTEAEDEVEDEVEDEDEDEDEFEYENVAGHAQRVTGARHRTATPANTRTPQRGP